MTMDKLWITNEINQEDINNLAKIAGIPNLLARVFLSRGIGDLEYIKEFLTPTLKNLHDPFLLNDMEKAVKRISNAISTKQKIVVYGDYDVDGITSTSILNLFLKSQDCNVSYYIPDRIEEGYGLSIKAIDEIIKNPPDLIITVDCGIVSYNEVEYINSKNIDIIITDHHECQKLLPPACAVINPHRVDNSYPYHDLAGVGVTFKLIHALCVTLNLGNKYLDYLDLVAIGTIADIVPLTGENRVIVSNGLIAINNTSNIGLNALIEITGQKEKEITSYNVGFGIAPRINAAGRLGDPERAVKLFTTNSILEAQEISSELNDENKRRQDTEQEILEKALIEIESDPAYRNEPVIVVSGKGWHHGVIGIVSSRITERYYKPSIVISTENGMGKGSARSIPEFNLFDALNSSSELFEKFGGHKAAAGLSLKEENIMVLRKQINEYASQRLTAYDLTPKIRLDAETLPSEITLEAIKTLDRMAPFGQENPKPLFIGRGYKIEDLRTLSEDKHLKLNISKDKQRFDTIGFSLGSFAQTNKVGQIIDTVFYPEINTWNNIERVQLNLKDLRPNTEFILQKEFYKSLHSLIDNMDFNSENSKPIDPLETDHLTFQKNKLNLGDEFYLAINNTPTLIITNTLLASKKIIEELNSPFAKLSSPYKIFYETHEILENNPISLLINANLDNIDINSYKSIILAGEIFQCRALSNFINRSNLENIYHLSISSKNTQNNTIQEFSVNRNEVGFVYKYFTTPGHLKITISDPEFCANDISNKFNTNINSFKLIKILNILHEINIINCKNSDNCNIILHINQNCDKRDLNDSKTFNILSKLGYINN